MFMSISRKFLFLHDIQLSIFGWNLIHWDSEKLLKFNRKASIISSTGIRQRHSKGILCRITSIANFRLLNSARSILFILDTPNRLSCWRRQGIITYLTAFARSQPICSRTQAPTVHRFAGYRLFTVRKCIAPYTDHRIINLPVDFRSVLIRSSDIHQSHGGSFLVLPA